MARKILSLYMLIVLLILTVFPAIYFLKSSYKVEVKEPPSSYSGELRFVESHDSYELGYRYIHNNDSSTTFVYIMDTPGKSSYPIEKKLVKKLKEFNHLFIDHRGTGKSERMKSFSAYSVSKMSRDIHTVIKDAELEKYILFSHGVSSIIAQDFLTHTDLQPLKSVFINPVINFDKSAKMLSRDLAELFYVPDADSAQATEYFELYGYSIDDEVGFFGTSKIIATVENHKQWLFDTTKIEILDPKIAMEDRLYTYNELYDINHPSLTVGLFYSMFKTDFTSSYNRITDTVNLVFGKYDHFSKEAFDSIRHQIRFPYKEFTLDSSVYYPHLENTESFLKLIRQL